MLEKDSILLGIILGLCVPFVGFATIKMFFEQLASMELLNPEMRTIFFRERTIAILAICLNLIPFNIYKRWRFDQTMRGVLFATFVYVFAWVWFFAATMGQG